MPSKHLLAAAAAAVLGCNNDPKPSLTSGLTLDSFDPSADSNDDNGDDPSNASDNEASDDGPTPTSDGSASDPTTDPTADTSASDATTAPTSDATTATSASDPTTDATTDPTATTGDDTGPVVCDPPGHAACDNGTADPFKAIGLGCAGEPAISTSKTGDAGAIGVRSNFGQAAAYDAREGSQFAVIGTGNVAELNSITPQQDPNNIPTYCSDALAGSPDPGASLPAPLATNDVAGDCTSDPNLLGTGDCSNTIQSQFAIGGSAFDLAELRVTVDVPPGVTALTYDFAFFSTEYPYYFDMQFADMYIAWLESERWTGNVSYDGTNTAISLNSDYFTIKDDAGSSPIVAATCMRQHGGTPWLTSTVPVTPGETITLVFAIFDMADGILDSYVFLDDFRWTCDDPPEPTTQHAP